MKRYLCPICEQELTAKHYCPTCRKMVKEPLVYDGVLPNEDTGNYLLNHQDLHPDRACINVNQDRVCETGAEKMQEARFSQGVNTGKAVGRQSTAPGSQIWRSGATTTRTYTGSVSSGTGRSRTVGRKSKKPGCLTVIIFIVWMIGVLGSILGDVLVDIDVESWFEGQLTPDIRDDIEVSLSPDAAGDSMVVPVPGERCNGYWHYPVSGVSVYEQLVRMAEDEIGLIMVDESEYMLNEADTSVPDGYTYYDQSYYWDWEDGNFSVSCDSATGELHCVIAHSPHADEVIEILVEAFCLADDPDAEDTMRTALSEAVLREDIGDGCFIEMGNSLVWIYQDTEYGYFMGDLYPATE